MPAFLAETIHHEQRVVDREPEPQHGGDRQHAGVDVHDPAEAEHGQQCPAHRGDGADHRQARGGQAPEHQDHHDQGERQGHDLAEAGVLLGLLLDLVLEHEVPADGDLAATGLDLGLDRGQPLVHGGGLRGGTGVGHPHRDQARGAVGRAERLGARAGPVGVDGRGDAGQGRDLGGGPGDGVADGRVVHGPAVHHGGYGAPGRVGGGDDGAAPVRLGGGGGGAGHRALEDPSADQHAYDQHDRPETEHPAPLPVAEPAEGGETSGDPGVGGRPGVGHEGGSGGHGRATAHMRGVPSVWGRVSDPSGNSSQGRP